MTDYYDLVLGLIPLALVSITGVLTLAGVALTVAVPVASLVAVGLMGHAMFVRAPVDSLPGDAPATAPARDTPFDAAD
jgi:hypothetical protein